MEKPDDFLFPDAQKQRKHMEEKGLVFAQRYLVFDGPTADPRAKALLDHWTRTVRRQKVSPSASAQELAYFNGRREFVELIREQVEFAQNGANLPPVKS